MLLTVLVSVKGKAKMMKGHCSLQKGLLVETPENMFPKCHKPKGFLKHERNKGWREELREG